MKYDIEIKHQEVPVSSGLFIVVQVIVTQINNIEVPQEIANKNIITIPAEPLFNATVYTKSKTERYIGIIQTNHQSILKKLYFLAKASQQ